MQHHCQVKSLAPLTVLAATSRQSQGFKHYLCTKIVVFKLVGGDWRRQEKKKKKERKTKTTFDCWQLRSYLTLTVTNQDPQICFLESQRSCSELWLTVPRAGQTARFALCRQAPWRQPGAPALSSLCVLARKPPETRLPHFPYPKPDKTVQSNQEFYAHQMPFHNLYLHLKKTSRRKTSNSFWSW